MARGGSDMEMVVQKLFTLGEVDQINWKRTDIEGYLSGAQSLQNMTVATTGHTQKANGTNFSMDVTTSAVPTSKLYEFRDNSGNFYVIYIGATVFNVYQLNTAGDALTFIQSVGALPYPDAALPLLDYATDGDSLVLTGGGFFPARIYVPSYNGAVPPAPNTFAYQPLNIFPFPAYDFGTINYNGYTVAVVSDADGSYTITFSNIPNTDPPFTTAWIGGQIIGGGIPTNLAQPLGAGIITGVVTTVGATTTTVFTVVAQTQFASGTDASVIGSSYSVKQPAWSATLGYPNKVIFYQNRLFFANTFSLPDTVFGSKIGQVVSFDVGVGLDTDAIVYNIGQSGTGGIQWLNAGKQLEIYTRNFEFVCPQDQNSALTPSTFSIRQQSSYGASTLMKPVSYINDSYYLARNGKAIINFHFEGVGLAYASSNISQHSSHLVNSPTKAVLIRGTDVSQDNFIYFSNGTPDVTSFQFAAEYKLAALTPRTFDQNGTINILDVVSVNNTLIYLKQYGLNGKLTLEIQGNESVSTIGTVKMDSMLNTTMNSSGVVNTGIAHFEGYFIHAVSPTGDLGESLTPVTGGSTTFENPNSYTGAVTVGILFDCQVTPMYTYAAPQGSDYYKNVTRIFVDYYQSLDFTVNGTPVFYQSFAEIAASVAAGGSYVLTPKTDTAVVAPGIGWDRFSTFTIDQTSPYDLIVTGIDYQVNASII